MNIPFDGREPTGGVGPELDANVWRSVENPLVASRQNASDDLIGWSRFVLRLGE
jgi:hypothetical protein